MNGRPGSFIRWLALACLLTGAAGGTLAAEKAAPQVSVSLRGVEAATIGQGEPWRVVVRVDLPRGSQGTVELAPADGTWADAIRVELYQATGATAVARAEPVGKPAAATATLDARHVAGGLWRFSPESMQAVAPGPYRLRVQLKIDSGGGWQGVVGREIPLTVVGPASKPAAQRVANRAQDLLLTDQVQAAATLVDAELKNAPRDYSLLKVRAQIAERGGNPLAAILCLNAATFTTAGKPSGPPPAEDIDLRTRLEKSRLAARTAPEPPAWTWPPAEVLTALSLEAQRSSLVPGWPPGSRNDSAPTIPTNPPRRATTPANTVPAVMPPPQPAPAQPPAASASAPTPALPALAGPPPGVVVSAAELNDAKIAADPAGQWAASATAGSQYGRTQYSAAQAAGAPNISVAGNSPDAWCPASRTSGTDWLEVTFAKPVRATEVRVRQNDAAGAIAKIEAIEADGTAHVWWEGVDPSKPPAVREIVWFAVRVPRTDYLVAKVKITLNLASGPGWKQIDAVQLVADDDTK